MLAGFPEISSVMNFFSTSNALSLGWTSAHTGDELARASMNLDHSRGQIRVGSEVFISDFRCCRSGANEDEPNAFSKSAKALDEIPLVQNCANRSLVLAFGINTLSLNLVYTKTFNKSLLLNQQ